MVLMLDIVRAAETVSICESLPGILAFDACFLDVPDVIS